MLVVAALTLAVVAFAGRRRDPVVRLLLAALCLLCLVVLASAQNRLGLVVDAYGLTRVRIAGEAIVPWLALLLMLVLAAGARPGVARRAPRLALTGSLLAVPAFSLSNPDRRIAERAVERHADTGRIDVAYLAQLSADAIPALEELPPPLSSSSSTRPPRHTAGSSRPIAGASPTWRCRSSRGRARLLEHLLRSTERRTLVGTWAAAEWAIRFYRRHGLELVSPARKTELLQAHWSLPERQIETSVVLELGLQSGCRNPGPGAGRSRPGA